MTTVVEAFTTVKTALRDTVTWPSPAPRLVFPNEGAPTGKEFIKVWIDNKRSFQRSQGPKPNRSWHRGGEVLLAIHTELGKGDARALTLAQAVKDGLEGETIDGVLFRAQTEIESGTLESWYFLVISISFDYYEHK